MGRIYKGLLVRTSYGTGPFRVMSFTENCTCPKFIDLLNMGDNAPLSKPHYHCRCRKDGDRQDYYLNGYDENLNSVWSEDRLIDLSEEMLTLIITLL